MNELATKLSQRPRVREQLTKLRKDNKIYNEKKIAGHFVIRVQCQ